MVVMPDIREDKKDEEDETETEEDIKRDDEEGRFFLYGTWY